MIPRTGQHDLVVLCEHIDRTGRVGYDLDKQQILEVALSSLLFKDQEPAVRVAGVLLHDRLLNELRDPQLERVVARGRRLWVRAFASLRMATSVASIAMPVPAAAIGVGPLIAISRKSCR